jgi:hypothetical protein
MFAAAIVSRLKREVKNKDGECRRVLFQLHTIVSIVTFLKLSSASTFIARIPDRLSMTELLRGLQGACAWLSSASVESTQDCRRDALATTARPLIVACLSVIWRRCLPLASLAHAKAAASVVAYRFTRFRLLQWRPYRSTADCLCCKYFSLTY